MGIAATEIPAPQGSRWYDAGHHWEVVSELDDFEGEPGVMLRCLSGSGRKPLELTVKDGKTSFNLPRPMWDSMATVVVVEFEGDRIVR